MHKCVHNPQRIHEESIILFTTYSTTLAFSVEAHHIATVVLF